MFACWRAAVSFRHVTAHKSDDCGLLLAATCDQAGEPGLQFMLQAVDETSKWTTWKMAAIRKLADTPPTT